MLFEKNDPRQDLMISLINELELNKHIIKYKGLISIPFEINQFHVILKSGLLSFLDSKIKDSIFSTYSILKDTNRIYNNN